MGELIAMGDSCLSLVLQARIDPAVNARCVAIAASLEQRARPGIRDVVPTYNAVTVHFNPVLCDREVLSTELTALGAMDWPDPASDRTPVTIPVKYGGEFGPDLAAVAAFGACSEQEVVRLHTSTVYRVYMLGFLPGFAYLGSVDPRIAMPRLSAPRARVFAGSIGIAGAQTGIYPCDTPGGWRIVGRAEVRVFDSGRVDPSLLKAGDHVRFEAV